jgi:hypothetical protein
MLILWLQAVLWYLRRKVVRTVGEKQLGRVQGPAVSKISLHHQLACSEPFAWFTNVDKRHACCCLPAALQICIDLFLLAQAYVDIATLSTLAHTTGGSLYHYLPFNPMMDQDQLLNDLKWNVSRPQVSLAVQTGPLLLLLLLLVMRKQSASAVAVCRDAVAVCTGLLLCRK